VHSAIRADFALVVLALAAAGCGSTAPSVFPQFAGDHDRYLQGNIEHASKIVCPWLEQHHCLLDPRTDSGVMWIECTSANNQHFHVTLTPWQKNDVLYTRIHIEASAGSFIPEDFLAQLLQCVDAQNDGTAATSIRLAKTDPRALDKQNQSDEARAVERIKKLHGKLVRDMTQPGSPVTTVDLHSTHATDEDVAMLRCFPNLVKLNLYGTRITDASLANLVALPGLTTLYLNQTEIDDAGVEQLLVLKNLHELGLYRTRVTDRGVARLEYMPSLQQLTLGGKQITDAGIVHLKTLTGLHELGVRDTAVTDAGVTDLKKSLPKLVVLR
jgi:Leucine-rich repeat (LRR) protein